MAECGTFFQCKAGDRPIQKQETDFKALALDYCFNDGKGWMASTELYRASLASCCYMKDVCLGTCGITYEECFKRFYKCAEFQCDRALSSVPDQEKSTAKHVCLDLANYNDATQIWSGRKPRLSTKNRRDEKGTCADFRALQKEACDCVPAGEYDKALKKRAEDFLRLHDPSQLNKKGEISKKLWSTGKGKRAEAYFELMMRFNASVEIQHSQKKQAPAPPGHSADHIEL